MSVRIFFYIKNIQIKKNMYLYQLFFDINLSNKVKIKNHE
jgi:hypothetical protein